MSKVTVCRAKNPSSCRFHGTLEAHEAAYNKANDEYLATLRDLLAAGPEEVVLRNRAARLGEVANRWRASVDSHDSNFEALRAREVYLRERLDSGEAEGWDDSEYNDVVERIRAAEVVREGRTRHESAEELGWVKVRTAEILPGARIQSGEIVTSVHRRAKLPSQKREVYLKNRETGKVRAAVWNANTIIRILPRGADDELI